MVNALHMAHTCGSAVANPVKSWSPQGALEDHIREEVPFEKLQCSRLAAKLTLLWVCWEHRYLDYLPFLP